MNNIPFIAIGNDELGEPVGKYTICPKCKKKHLVKYGDEIIDGKKVKSTLLGYVKCGKSSYAVAIKGMRI